MDTKTKLLALVCACCPVCISARAFPNSGFAKKVHEMEKDCPACNAYKKVQAAKRCGS